MQFIKSTDYMKNLIILSEIDKKSIHVSVDAGQQRRHFCGNGKLVHQKSVRQWLCGHAGQQQADCVSTYSGRHGTQTLSFGLFLWPNLLILLANVSEQIKQMLLPVVKDGGKSVIFYGAGETGLVCVKVAAEIPLFKNNWILLTITRNCIKRK